MNTKQMEYIIKIAETKSILKAAEELFLTQSALDQQLLKLEKELHTKFFIRSRQNLTLTPAGEIYVSYAKRILALKKEAYTMIGDISKQNSGTLSIGLTPERGIEMFMAVYPEFYKKYPKMNVVPREINVRPQLAMLRSDEIDVGFITISKKEIEGEAITQRHILSEQFVIAVPSRHPVIQELPKLSANRLPLSLLRDVPFVMMFKRSTQHTIVEPLFLAAGFQPNVILRTASNRTSLRMVENGLCCSILPEYYAVPNEKISYFRLEHETSWDLLACTKRGKYVGSAALDFIKLASEFWIKRHNEKASLFHTPPRPYAARAIKN